MNYQTRSERIDTFIEAFLKSSDESRLIFSLFPSEIKKIQKGNYGTGIGVITHKPDDTDPNKTVCSIYKLS